MGDCKNDGTILRDREAGRCSQTGREEHAHRYKEETREREGLQRPKTSSHFSL